MKEEDKKYLDLKKLAKKIEDNSFWKTYIPNIFYFYNKDVANNFTKIGKYVIKEMKKQWENMPN